LSEHEDEDADSKNSGGDSRKSGSDSRKSELSGMGRMSRRVSSERRKDSLKLGVGINVIDTDATERNLLT
jgi:WD40 repeat protein